MMRIGGSWPRGDPRRAAAACWPAAWCAPAPGWCGCAAACARRPAPGLKKKVSCISRAGCLGGKFRPVKLWKSSSMSGPFGDGEAHLGEDGDHLVHHLHGRVHRALAARRRRAGSGRRRSAASWASSAAASSAALRAAIGGGDAVAQAVDRRALLAPLVRAHARPGTSAGRRSAPVLPSAATRTASSAARSARGGDLGRSGRLRGWEVGHGVGLAIRSSLAKRGRAGVSKRSPRRR